MQKVNFQLYATGAGSQSGEIITASGGFVIATAANDATKATLYDKNGASQANGLALTNGGATFYVADSVSSVDLYIMTPGGQFVVKTGVIGTVDIGVDTSIRNQVAKIPFSATDSTAATEKDTGYDLPLYSMVLPTPAILVTTIDATETINIGLLSSETAGDADGFIAAASVGTAGLVNGTLANGANTMGALFEVQDSANAGDLAPSAHVVTGSNATSITYTLTTGSDTAEGFIILPYVLTA
ncbi:MAG: hypothetical protein EG825_00395 [Rhodocyclaceae bacterium]|nr:hypothetical protein [Rhodocyclaceae bacterium]